MKTRLDIKKSAASDAAWFNKHHCGKCNQEIESESNYVEYGMKYAKNKFHLTCFNNMEQKELKKAELCYNNIKIDLKQIEDFKKRVLLTKIKPMVVNNIEENTRRFRLKIGDRFYNQDRCDQCSQIIDKGDIYVDNGASPMKNYHFVCFQEAAKTKLKKWEKYKTEVQDNLNKLEPYKKEMICEAMQGVGKR
jgi:hypothetical protein